MNYPKRSGTFTNLPKGTKPLVNLPKDLEAVGIRLATGAVYCVECGKRCLREYHQEYQVLLYQDIFPCHQNCHRCQALMVEGEPGQFEMFGTESRSELDDLLTGFLQELRSAPICDGLREEYPVVSPHDRTTQEYSLSDLETLENVTKPYPVLLARVR